MEAAAPLDGGQQEDGSFFGDALGSGDLEVAAEQAVDASEGVETGGGRGIPTFAGMTIE